MVLLCCLPLLSGFVGFIYVNSVLLQTTDRSKAKLNIHPQVWFLGLLSELIFCAHLLFYADRQAAGTSLSLGIRFALRTLSKNPQSIPSEARQRWAEQHGSCLYASIPHGGSEKLVISVITSGAFLQPFPA